MSSKLHQLTMSYLPKEDRILLRIGTAQNTEYRLWLTRRFVKSIWGGLKKILEGSLARGNDMQPKVRQAVIAMEHQESVQSSDFTKKHSTKNVNITPMPIQDLDQEKTQSPEGYKEKKDQPSGGASDGGILVVGGRIKKVGHDLTLINFKLDNNTGVEFTLNKKLLHALCHMIIQSTTKAGWHLDLVIGDSQVLSSQVGSQFH